nr:RNA-directed DNA polymerase, eukaryota [Tanacetum cinerariifolium]
MGFDEVDDVPNRFLNLGIKPDEEYIEGEVIMMGDFNEVRLQSDRFGLVFHARDAEVFNSFILNAEVMPDMEGGMPENNVFGESSDPDAIAETVFTESVGLNGMQSADPFDIYDLLNKEKQQENTKVSDDSISREHPPGFTPKEDDKELDHVDDNIFEPKEDLQ